MFKWLNCSLRCVKSWCQADHRQKKGIFHFCSYNNFFENMDWCSIPNFDCSIHLCNRLKRFFKRILFLKRWNLFGYLMLISNGNFLEGKMLCTNRGILIKINLILYNKKVCYANDIYWVNTDLVCHNVLLWCSLYCTSYSIHFLYNFFFGVT